MTYLSDEATLDLAIEILKQASSDYKWALANEGDEEADYFGEGADYLKWDCERFFRSSYFELLTMGQADGERVITELKKEVADELTEKAKKIRFTHPSERDAVRGTDGKVQESEIAQYWGTGSSFY